MPTTDARTDPGGPGTDPGADSTARPVVALYDGSTAARDTVVRAAGTAARTVVVGPPGSAARLGDLAPLVDAWVQVRSPALGAAVRTAVAQDAPWVCVPSTLMPSEDLLRNGLRTAVDELGPQRPGLVLHVVAPAATLASGRGPLAPYGRVVLVTDLEETTGLASYAAAAVAARSGAALDVVVTGRDEQGDDLQRLVAAAGERTDHESLLRARHALHAGGVAVRHLGAGAGADPVAQALRCVEALRPDLLVVGLGTRRLLEMAPDTRADPLPEVLAGARGRLVANLMAWLAVDVALVLDPVGPATALAAARARLGRTVDATIAVAR